jgi:transposase InsO family protein
VSGALKLDPARLEAFALAYVPAVLAASAAIGPRHNMPSMEEYAVSTALDMVSAIKRGGIEAVAHYYINGLGGAFKRTCADLKIEHSTRSLENYLEGK